LGGLLEQDRADAVTCAHQVTAQIFAGADEVAQAFKLWG
jgi:hypothetical protein